MASAIRTRPIGDTGLEVTEMGLGGAPFGNMYAPIDPADVLDTVRAAMAQGVRYLDTAPVYGFGLSETRIGQALGQLGDARPVLSSKVGYDLVPIGDEAPAPGLWAAPPPLRPVFDYSRDAVLRSIEATLRRLGVDHIDMLAIHDPDEAALMNGAADPFERSHFREAMDGAFPALADLRAQGVVKAIGVGINQWQMLCDFARAGDFDYFLLAGRYTLLDQSALAELMPLCARRNISLVIGSPYNTGILATGAVAGATYDYQPAPDALLARTRAIEAVCGRHGVSLQAAALQFPLLHPLVASVIPGARSRAEVRAAAGFLVEAIPPQFWQELKHEGLIDPAAPTG